MDPILTQMGLMASYHPMDVMPCAQLSIFTNAGEFLLIGFLLN